jgi:hypothetical protein
LPTPRSRMPSGSARSTCSARPTRFSTRTWRRLAAERPEGTSGRLPVGRVVRRPGRAALLRVGEVPAAGRRRPAVRDLRGLPRRDRPAAGRGRARRSSGCGSECYRCQVRVSPVPGKPATAGPATAAPRRTPPDVDRACLRVGCVTVPPRRRKRTTDAQRQLAAQWLARTGAGGDPHRRGRARPARSADGPAGAGRGTSLRPVGPPGPGANPGGRARRDGVTGGQCGPAAGTQAGQGRRARGPRGHRPDSRGLCGGTPAAHRGRTELVRPAPAHRLAARDHRWPASCARPAGWPTTTNPARCDPGRRQQRWQKPGITPTPTQFPSASTPRDSRSTTAGPSLSSTVVDDTTLGQLQVSGWYAGLTQAALSHRAIAVSTAATPREPRPVQPGCRAAPNDRGPCHRQSAWLLYVASRPVLG